MWLDIIGLLREEEKKTSQIVQNKDGKTLGCKFPLFTNHYFNCKQAEKSEPGIDDNHTKVQKSASDPSM